MPSIRSLALVGLCTVLFAMGLGAQERFALVIGNGSYTSITKLKNPANDASDVAAALKELGFKVDLVTDASLDDMEGAVIRLGNNLSQSKGSYGFFYYAGHGVQSGGVNYLIPADADIKSENFLKTKALAAQSVLDTLQSAKNGLNVIILDACRDNPFGWSRGGSRGIGIVSTQPSGSIVVYATSAGSVAQDGDGRNGLFTAALLKHIKTPGLDIADVFKRTGAEVQKSSANAQIPAVYNQFFGEAYLAGPGAAKTPEARLAEGDGQIKFGGVKQAQGWLSVNLESRGRLSFQGQSRDLDPGSSLSIEGVSPGSYDISVSYEDGYAESQRVTVEPGKETLVAFGYLMRTKAPAGFVLVEAGSFYMGSDKGDKDEKPSHRVDLASFFLARCEVTQAEYQAVMGLNPSEFKGDDLPVDQVSWFDAVQFCNALSLAQGLSPAYQIKGGKVSWDRAANGYRLPTEAEWEYAARGGSGGARQPFAFSGGDDGDGLMWNESNSGSTSHPVGQKAANQLGLYDMSGNQWEWCWDWYGPYPRAAQSNPEGPAGGSYRVGRGGSWYNLETHARVSNRGNFEPARKRNYYGFRLALPAR